jgi:hypothetical protein
MRVMRAGWMLAVLAAAVPAADAGDPEDELAPITPVLDISSGRSFSDRIAEQLTLLGESVDGHLGLLTQDSLRLRIDGRARRARVRLAGETRYLSLRVSGDLHFRRGAAEVDARIDLLIGGHTLGLELPDFEVVPRSFAGERYVEVRVPLLRGSF